LPTAIAAVPAVLFAESTTGTSALPQEKVCARQQANLLGPIASSQMAGHAARPPERE
jgi:hypothetical protein